MNHPIGYLEIQYPSNAKHETLNNITNEFAGIWNYILEYPIVYRDDEEGNGIPILGEDASPLETLKTLQSALTHYGQPLMSDIQVFYMVCQILSHRIALPIHVIHNLTASICPSYFRDIAGLAIDGTWNPPLRLQNPWAISAMWNFFRAHQMRLLGSTTSRTQAWSTIHKWRQWSCLMIACDKACKCTQSETIEQYSNMQGFIVCKTNSVILPRNMPYPYYVLSDEGNSIVLKDLRYHNVDTVKRYNIIPIGIPNAYTYFNESTVVSLKNKLLDETINFPQLMFNAPFDANVMKSFARIICTPFDLIDPPPPIICNIDVLIPYPKVLEILAKATGFFMDSCFSINMMDNRNRCYEKEITYKWMHRENGIEYPVQLRRETADKIEMTFWETAMELYHSKTIETPFIVPMGECSLCSITTAPCVTYPCAHILCQSCYTKWRVPVSPGDIFMENTRRCPQCRELFVAEDDSNNIKMFFEKNPEGIPPKYGARCCQICENIFVEPLPCGQELDAINKNCSWCCHYKHKNCPHCGISYVKSNGCNYIQCEKCRTDFCHICQYIITVVDGITQASLLNRLHNSSWKCQSEKTLQPKCDDEWLRKFVIY